MTEEEIAREAEQYDRFYPELTSFCRPDLKTGPAPKQVTRSYKLVLVQGAKVVDVYQMPNGEQITGIEVSGRVSEWVDMCVLVRERVSGE